MRVRVMIWSAAVAAIVFAVSALVAGEEDALQESSITAVALVAGGFRLRSTEKEELRSIATELKGLGVNKIRPSHCTGDAAKAILREQWANNFVSFDLGDRYRF